MVPVPETSVHENGCAVGAQHYVGAAGHRLYVESVAVAVVPEPLPHLELRLGALAVYVRHAAVALIFS